MHRRRFAGEEGAQKVAGGDHEIAAVDRHPGGKLAGNDEFVCFGGFDRDLVAEIGEGDQAF